MTEADIGLIGLAVMGQNLVLNMDDHGYRVLLIMIPKIMLLVDAKILMQAAVLLPKKNLQQMRRYREDSNF